MDIIINNQKLMIKSISPIVLDVISDGKVTCYHYRNVQLNGINDDIPTCGVLKIPNYASGELFLKYNQTIRVDNTISLFVEYAQLINFL